MIFTVTKEGISHNPKEYCSPEDWYVKCNLKSLYQARSNANDM